MVVVFVLLVVKFWDQFSNLNLKEQEPYRALCMRQSTNRHCTRHLVSCVCVISLRLT